MSFPRIARSTFASRVARPTPLLRTFVKPSSVLLKEKTDGGHEEHRVEVERKDATIDENMTFEHPKQWTEPHPGHDSSLIAITVSTDAHYLIAGQNGEAKEGEIEALGVGCDVSDEESVKAAFALVKEKFGRLDAVVTAAGIVENFVAQEYPTPKVKKLLDINVMGTWFCALEAAKLMPEGGSITLVGSMSGSVVNVPQPQTPYNFSKAAVRHMARSLAVEWATKNIRVNCLAPGYTLTNLTKVILDGDPVLRDEWLNRIPVGRLADPSDLKGAVIYLASDSSKYTTGTELVVDGGYTCL